MFWRVAVIFVPSTEKYVFRLCSELVLLNLFELNGEHWL